MPDLATFRNRLVAARDALVQEIDEASAAAEPVELDQTRVGRVSRMDAMQAQAMSKAGLNRRRQRVQQIDAALARVENGTYGQCASCDEPIAASRLELAPANPLCVECAEQRER